MNHNHHHIFFYNQQSNLLPTPSLPPSLPAATTTIPQSECNFEWRKNNLKLKKINLNIKRCVNIALKLTSCALQLENRLGVWENHRHNWQTLYIPSVLNRIIGSIVPFSRYTISSWWQTRQLQYRHVTAKQKNART